MKRAKARNTLPVGQLKKLRLRANDILVVTARREIFPAYIESLRTCIRDFGSTRILVCQDIALTTIRRR